LNYFNYFTEIEDAFIRRRGKHLLLSPMDWALIESWKEMDVPLHVALRGIEKSFDSWESKPRKRSVKSLLYCQEEVEAQFSEWRESRVGSSNNAGHDSGSIENQPVDRLPFSAPTILEHLRGAHVNLIEARKQRMLQGEDDLTDALQRASSLLADLATEFAASSSPDAQKLEQSLSGVERMLSDCARSVVESVTIDRIQKEVTEQLKPYRKRMDVAVYNQTFDNLLLKRLREHFGIPRLSLFYL
jgi:hypothetical protein